MKNMYLSIVIPAYNEEKNIRLGSLDKVLRFLEKQRYAWEVIIVDDGSNDNTSDLLDSFRKINTGCTVVHNKHQGKAASVMTGVHTAKGNIVLFCDLDQATPISEVDKILPWFKKGYDIVIGSRNSHREGAPLTRVFMARGFIFLRGIILGLAGITDTQCGFKAFRQPIALKIFEKLKLYGKSDTVSGSMVTAGFDIEVLFLAKEMGYQIKEVPIEWHYVETRRVNPLRDSIQGLVDIISIKINALQGAYKV